MADPSLKAAVDGLLHQEYHKIVYKPTILMIFPAVGLPPQPERPDGPQPQRRRQKN